MKISHSSLSIYKTLDELSSKSNIDYSISNWSGAVLMLIIDTNLVFIKRSETMPSHKGQIGFMGGHKKKTEIDPIQTAKREFVEESSISESYLNCLGMMDPVKTSHQNVIIPILAEYKESLQHFKDNVKSNEEWDDLIITPLNYLANNNNWQVGSVLTETNYTIYFSSLNHLDSYSHSCDLNFSYVLWGASAKMVCNLFQIHFVDAKKSV
jgi:8-oxo-dGTP pyrophosphatase MutT (NUDIX family)